MTNEERLYRVWLSDTHFIDWDDFTTNIIPFSDMTLDELHNLMDLALVRGYEVIVMGQTDGDGA